MMSNTQLWIAVGLPIIAVLTSLVISMLQISGIREDIREIRSDIKLLTGKVEFAAAADMDRGRE